MTTIQIVLLICIAAVIVGAGLIIGVSVHHHNAERRSELSSSAPTAKQSASRQAVSESTAAQPASGGPAQPAASAASPGASGVERPESSESRIVRLRSRLAGSTNPFGKAMFSILSRDNLSESDWQDVEDTLLMADVGAEASEQIVDSLRADARVKGEKDPAQLRELLRERLLVAVGTDMDRRLAVNLVKPPSAEADGDSEADTDASGDVVPDEKNPSVIIMVGVNGTGKTTTAGKLGRLLVAEGKTVIMAAADTFRAAAADQLETWGKRVGIPVVRGAGDGVDPASVAFDAVQEAKRKKVDALIVDTAGRLQNKANLMDELGKIRRVIEKTMPVDEVLLVLDATTGQNGMTQARVFAQAIGITGVVLTKLDGSAKGGIVISVQRELGVPVKLVGLGEGPDDLAVFDPVAFVDGILG